MSSSRSVDKVVTYSIIVYSSQKVVTTNIITLKGNDSMKNERATMTVREMAELLGISYNTANQLTWRENFPVIQIGRKKLIPRDALEAWLLEQKRVY